VGSASADVGPGDSNCAHGTRLSSTNDWHFFWAHKIRAAEAICWDMGNGDATHHVNYPMMRWVDTPVITFPSTFPIPSGETMSWAKRPWLYSTTKQYGDIVRVSWHFSVRHCNGPCQTFDFSFVVKPTEGTHLCVIGGACDTWKAW
jgi:hypothetical protein